MNEPRFKRGFFMDSLQMLNDNDFYGPVRLML